MNTYTAAAWQWQPTYNYYNPNELYHHGIMGMRWGKRHGPPYPLAPSAHSAEEKRLKSQNEGKLDSWKAKETAKVNKYYDKKIAKAEAKLDKYNEKGKAKKWIKTNRKITSMMAKEAIEKSAISKMNLKDVRAEKIALGKDIAKGVLGYAVATGAKAVASKGTAAALALGNVPVALVAAGFWHAGDAYQLVKAAKAIRGAVTGRRRTKLKERQNFLNNKATSESISRARSMRSQGKTYAEIAKELGVSEGVAWAFVNDDHDL